MGVWFARIGGIVCKMPATYNVMCTRMTEKMIQYPPLSKGKNGRPLVCSLSELLGEKGQTFSKHMKTYFYVVASVGGSVF
jgi:hypothetical protein